MQPCPAYETHKFNEQLQADDTIYECLYEPTTHFDKKDDCDNPNN